MIDDHRKDSEIEPSSDFFLTFGEKLIHLRRFKRGKEDLTVQKAKYLIYP